MGNQYIVCRKQNLFLSFRVALFYLATSILVAWSITTSFSNKLRYTNPALQDMVSKVASPLQLLVKYQLNLLDNVSIIFMWGLVTVRKSLHILTVQLNCNGTFEQTICRPVCTVMLQSILSNSISRLSACWCACQNADCQQSFTFFDSNSIQLLGWQNCGELYTWMFLGCNLFLS